MEQQNQDEILEQLRETNNRLRKLQNVMIGVLITTGIMTIFFVILYSKISKLMNMAMDDF
jgi:predicted membrane channel-forming protein YqfA (hemolysin III family)